VDTVRNFNLSLLEPTCPIPFSLLYSPVVFVLSALGKWPKRGLNIGVTEKNSNPANPDYHRDRRRAMII